jgi:hypothetical protein
MSGGKQVNIKFMLIIRLVPVDNLKEIIRYIFKKHNRLWFAQDNLVSRHINSLARGALNWSNKQQLIWHFGLSKLDSLIH